MNIETTIRVIFFIAVAIAASCMLYGLFIFGHTETASLGRILTVAAIGAVSAGIAGLIQWAGVPTKGADDESASSK